MYFLVKARLICKDIILSTDPDLLSKVLSEKGLFNLAVDLAILNNVSPAYALAQLIIVN